MVLGIILGVVVVLLILFGCISYVKAPPDQAYIISGKRKTPKILIGKAGFKIPFFDRMDKINLALIPIDVKTTGEVPTADYIDIAVDAAVNVKVGRTPEALELASINFLNRNTDYIRQVAREVLEGNMKEIIGQIRLEEMVSDKQKFATLVSENAAPDLGAMGLEIISFNVQSFLDKNGVIQNLGVDNVVRIQKSAAISRAQAERDIAIEKAKASQEANDAKVAAAEQIAVRNAELEQRQADLKKATDTRQAQADAAMNIEAENQRKLRDVAATDANIAKAEREAELKKKQIELKEYELDALVRKQADADKYAAEQKAEVELIRRQKAAEAKAYEIKQEAEAIKAKAEAERFAAEQQAAGIEKIGAAEAVAIEKKAAAQKKMGEASVIEMTLKALPQIVASATGPLENVDSITMYGSDNSSAMVGDIMKTTNQVMEGLKANGIDLSSLISGFIGGKAADKN